MRMRGLAAKPNYKRGNLLPRYLAFRVGHAVISTYSNNTPLQYNKFWQEINSTTEPFQLKQVWHLPDAHHQPPTSTRNLNAQTRIAIPNKHLSPPCQLNIYTYRLVAVSSDFRRIRGLRYTLCIGSWAYPACSTHTELIEHCRMRSDMERIW